MMIMLKGKTIDRICCLALVVMLALTAVIWTGKAQAGRQKTIEVGYEDLFDQSVVHTVDIEIADWDGLIESASQEEYVACDVTIDGEKLSSVGIRAKGNTSLSSVATLDSKKYSFKIEFDHFIEGRLYNGLDKLSLNNLIYDATMMKDYLAYTLMGRMDVPSPLCIYVQISVNGEPWGLYLAVEGVEDGFMERNNMTEGELYKPDSMSFGGGRGNGQDFDFEQFRVKDEEETDPDGEAGQKDISESGEEPQEDEAQSSGDFGGFPGQLPEGMSMPEGMFPPEGMSMPKGMTPPDGDKEGSFSMPNFGGNFNFGMGSSDVKLAYIDDDPESYSNIFNNAKTNIGKKDKTRLIEALKKLNAGEDIEDTVYTDEVIRYLAVHDFLQNGDSYTGMMVHNYYLYEQDGQLAIIPWDYNLGFGGMSAGDAASLVNSPIDSPVANGNTKDRPLIGWIFEDEDATAKYHEVYSQFVAETIESGWLESEIARVTDLIRPYVEADENAFYTAEEFDKAVDTLQGYCALRAESIRGQLDGTIPSTSSEQRADSTALVDASGLDVSEMGSMGDGGGFGGGPGGQMPGGSSSGNGSMPGSFSGPSSEDASTAPGGFPSFNGTAPGGFQGMPPETSTKPEESDSADTPTLSDTADSAAEGDTPALSDTADSAADGDVSDPAKTTNVPADGQSAPGTMPEGMSIPSGFTPPGDFQSASNPSMSWLELGVYAIILLLAVALVMRAPRHNR